MMMMMMMMLRLSWMTLRLFLFPCTETTQLLWKSTQLQNEGGTGTGAALLVKKFKIVAYIPASGEDMHHAVTSCVYLFSVWSIISGVVRAINTPLILVDAFGWEWMNVAPCQALCILTVLLPVAALSGIWIDIGPLCAHTIVTWCQKWKVSCRW